MANDAAAIHGNGGKILGGWSVHRNFPSLSSEVCVCVWLRC